MRKKEIRDTVRNTFIASVLGLAILVIYRLKNPYVFPGLTERAVATIVILFVLLVILYIDIEEFEWRRRRLYRKIRRKLWNVNFKPRWFRIPRRHLYFSHFSTGDAIHWIFQFVLVIYLLLLLLQQYASFTFNLNYILLAVIVFGVGSIFYEKESIHIERPPTKGDYLFGIFLGILGAVLIYIKTSKLGWLAYLISGIAGVLIILLSYLVLEEDEE